MERYRKKPVEVEAVRYDGSSESLAEISEMSGRLLSVRQSVLTIRTLEGDMIARPGDWIIKGVEGGVYPCKPSIFAATYEDATVDTVTIRADERERILRQRDHLLETVQRLASTASFTSALDLKHSTQVGVVAELSARGKYAEERFREATSPEMSRPTDWPS